MCQDELIVSLAITGDYQVSVVTFSVERIGFHIHYQLPISSFLARLRCCAFRGARVVCRTRSCNDPVHLTPVLISTLQLYSFGTLD